MFRRLTILVFLICLCKTIPLLAQKIEFGAGAGMMHYKGDIEPALHVMAAKPAANLFFRYNASKALSLRASFTGGRIYGSEVHSSDVYQQNRGIIFGTRIMEGSADLEYNFLDYQYVRQRPRNWSPYVFAGLGFFNFKPDQIPSASYRKNGLSIPFGAGIKWQIKSPWSIGIEFGTRKTWTDYLDNYAAAPQKDLYYYSCLSISYTILNIICPE
ncbi:MAG: DUF6089 family protein [Siphonobacter sp.]